MHGKRRQNKTFVRSTFASSLYFCPVISFFFFLWSPYVIGRPYIFSSCDFYLSFFLSFLSSPNLSGRRLDVCHTSTHGGIQGCNLGFIFDEHLTFSDQISAISKACYYHIRQLRCIRPYLDSNTARTIATSIVHSKLDYCNSLYYNLPMSQITRLQQVQNSLARAVVKTPKCCRITPILHSVHWLKITERIEYKHLSLTYKVLTTTQPPYLHNLISVQPPRNTRSSSHVTLARPPASCSLRITDRSFRYASPSLWNQLPSSLRQPHSSPSVSDLPVHAPVTSCYSFNSPISPSIRP